MEGIPTGSNISISVNTDNGKTEPIQTNKNINAVSMREPVNKYVCLFFIWATLAMVLFVRKVVIYQGFIQYIKAGNTEISDKKILIICTHWFNPFVYLLETENNLYFLYKIPQ